METAGQYEPESLRNGSSTLLYIPQNLSYEIKKASNKYAIFMSYVICFTYLYVVFFDYTLQPFLYFL